MTNNLFVGCSIALHIDARGLGWRSFGFDELKQKLELWPYQKEPWSTRYPRLSSILADEPMAPKGILVSRNILIDCPSWDDIESKAKPFLTMENNLPDARRSLLAPGDGLPRIKADATDVSAIGFEAIPVECIGVLRNTGR